MSQLAQYLPALEEVNPEDFADHDHSTEFTQYAVTVAGIEVGKDLADLDTAGEIAATLESIIADIEASEAITKVDRVFVGHSVQAIQRRIGLVIRTPSMESNDADYRTVSMEGIAQGLAKIWEGTVALIRKILLGIRDFFAMIFGFGKRKEKKIKYQLEKAKQGGNDAAISKLVENNLLKHLEDVSAMQKIVDNLVATPLEKVKPDKLVLLSPASAQVVVRESDGPVDSSKPMIVNGQDVVAMRKEDVKALEYMTLGLVKVPLVTAMAVNGGLTFRDKGKDSVLMAHEDVNEMVWDTAFRGKEVRQKGKDLAAVLMKMAIKAEKVFTSVQPLNRHKIDFEKELTEQTRIERETAYKIFREFVGKDDMVALGSSVIRINKFRPEKFEITMFNAYPSHTDHIGKKLKIKFPKYGEVSKAADGIVTVTLLSNFNGSIDQTLKSFDDVLKVYERLQAWAISQAKGDNITQRAVSRCINELFDEPVKYFTSYIRAQGVMETVVIGWGETITHPLSKLTDSKNLMKELA